MASPVLNAVRNNTPVLSKFFLGICVPSVKESAAKIRVPKLVLDDFLNMYFREFYFVYANDPQKLCKFGDTVLIRSLPQRLTRLITHEIVEVVYPLGDVVDPVSGKKVVVSRYRDDIQAERERFGMKAGFDYEKAPPRGSMEGKRDFTHRIHQVKFYEGQPDTV